MRNKKIYFSGIIILLSWFTAVITRLKYNGLVYGLDYGIYQPDGANFAFQSLKYLGRDPNSAAQLVADWYARHSYKLSEFTALDVLTDASVYPSSRIIFPLMSAPLIYFFGIKAIIFLPIFSLLVLQLCILYMGIKLNRVRQSVFTAVILTLSPTVLRWMISDCSDSIFASFFAILSIVLINKKMGYRTYIFTFLLIFLTSFTRFSLPIWIGIALILFVNKEKIKSIFILSISVIFALPALINSPKQLMPSSVNKSYLEKLLDFPFSFIKVCLVEVLELFVLDRILLLFIALALLVSARNLTKISSQYFIAVSFSVFILGGLNATLGVNFRYQLPLLPFACWAILDNFSELGNGTLWSRFNISGKKTKKQLKT